MKLNANPFSSLRRGKGNHVVHLSPRELDARLHVVVLSKPEDETDIRIQVIAQPSSSARKERGHLLRLSPPLQSLRIYSNSQHSGYHSRKDDKTDRTPYTIEERTSEELDLKKKLCAMPEQ